MEGCLRRNEGHVYKKILHKRKIKLKFKIGALVRTVDR